MIKKSLLIWFLAIICLYGQTDEKKEPAFIIPVTGVEVIEVPEKYRGDTLWVFGHKEYKKAIKIAKYHEIDTLRIRLMQEKMAIYGQILTEKDSVIADYKEGYVHYRDLWTDTSFKLEEAEVKASKRWQFFQVGFIVGAVAAIGVAAFARGL